MMICFHAYQHFTSPNAWLEWYYGNFHGVFKTPDDSGDDSSNDELLMPFEPVVKRSFQIAGASEATFKKLCSKDDPHVGTGSSTSGDIDSHANIIKKRFRQEENMKQREINQEKVRSEAAAKYHAGTFMPTFSTSPGPESGADAASAVIQSHGFDDHAPTVQSLELNGDIGNEDDECSEQHSDDVSAVSSESENGNTNQSAIEAHELARKAQIELSTISAESIWALFVNSKFRGGMLARTLFITAKAVQPIECTPWCGSTKLASKKKELADQRSSFLMWANSNFVLDWIRLEMYKIVSMKPHTYKQFVATHANAPRQASSGLQSEQASDDAMARIAHLACHSDSRVVLNMIFGAKDRHILDSKDLQPASLWQDLASVYVNNSNWQIQQMPVLQLEEYDTNTKLFVPKVDATKVPVVGLSGECVRESFTELKKWYSDVGRAVFGKTGVNATGEDFYGKTWTNYICGPYLYFPRKEVAMYVFKLWTETNNNESLPKYCIKELHPEAQIRLGVFKDDSKRGYMLPSTPRNSGTSPLLFSPGSQTSATTSTLQDSITSYVSFKMKQELANETKAPMFTPPRPNVAFAALLKEHGLLSVWDSGAHWALVY